MVHIRTSEADAEALATLKPTLWTSTWILSRRHMGRKLDLERQKLLKQLGLEGTKRNYSKKELLELQQKKNEKAQALAKKQAVTEIIAGPAPNLPPEEMNIQQDMRALEDPFTGLTERQKLVARLRMRGLSQTAISSIVGVSQPIISKELATIKAWQTDRGKNVNQGEVVGNTASLYEEVEYRAWELFHKTEEVGERAKALAVVMQAREKHTKLLMDLGLIKKASSEIKHTLEVSPFLQKWRDEDGKRQLADTLVARQLSELSEPTPDIEAELVDEDEDDEAGPSLADQLASDLAEPTFDDEEIEIEDE